MTADRLRDLTFAGPATGSLRTVVQRTSVDLGAEVVDDEMDAGGGGSSVVRK
jgi:hypothetical protein